MKILSVDIGGTNVKLMANHEAELRKFRSGKRLTPQLMVEKVLETTQDWDYEVISIGYPGVVAGGQPQFEPPNLGKGWVGFDFAAAFQRPVKVINDAAMQALGSYEGGRMVFIGLGTGVGSTLIVNKVIVPLDLGQLPFRESLLDDFLNRRGLKKLGKEAWLSAVHEAAAILKHTFMADYVTLGGGNAKKLSRLPPGTRRGDNRNAFLGGYRLWISAGSLTPTNHPTDEAELPPQEQWKLA